jgi:uncharacterized protein YceK
MCKFNLCRVPMKYKNTIVFLMCLFSFSSSSVTTHNVSVGHPYSGTEDSVKNFPCRTVNSMNYAMLTFPFVVLDVPFSFVLDTVLLPVDLLVSPKIERKFTTVHDKECS